MYGRSVGVAPLVKQLILYTGPQCHLCGQAKAVLDPLLARKGWDLVEVSIAEDVDMDFERNPKIHNVWKISRRSTFG